jgi:hypothetical protein
MLQQLPTISFATTTFDTIEAFEIIIAFVIASVRWPSDSSSVMWREEHLWNLNYTRKSALSNPVKHFQIT